MPYACIHAQSCPTLCDPTDYTLPDSFVHGILQAPLSMGFSRLEWVAISSSRAFLTQGLNLHLLHCRWILYC